MTAVNAHQKLAHATPMFDSLTGAKQRDKCIEVSQEPIGRRSNSNVATYLGVWDRIRKQFAATAQAKKAGFSAGFLLGTSPLMLQVPANNARVPVKTTCGLAGLLFPTRATNVTGNTIWMIF